jgi:hypothetical protein
MPRATLKGHIRLHPEHPALQQLGDACEQWLALQNRPAFKQLPAVDQEPLKVGLRCVRRAWAILEGSSVHIGEAEL